MNDLRLYARKVLYPPIANCERCNWMYDDPDAPKVRREARKHALRERHLVRITWEYATIYDGGVA